MFKLFVHDNYDAEITPVGTYPWWPAVIFEDDDLQIPPNILQLCQAERQKSNELIHILQFFDKSKSWCVPSLLYQVTPDIFCVRQYLGLDKLRMLGENNGLIIFRAVSLILMVTCSFGRRSGGHKVTKAEVEI